MRRNPDDRLPPPGDGDAARFPLDLDNFAFDEDIFTVMSPRAKRVIVDTRATRDAQPIISAKISRCHRRRRPPQTVAKDPAKNVIDRRRRPSCVNKGWVIVCRLRQAARPTT